MAKQDKPLESTDPKALTIACVSGSFLRKHKIDLDKAKDSFRKAAQAYISSKEHNRLVTSFRKLGAIQD